MAYAVGSVSGGHFNPAVTLGVVVAGKMKWSEVAPYVVAQAIGAILAASVLYFIATGRPGFELASGFAANGYGEHSPGGYSLSAAFVSETVMTAFFIFIILSITNVKALAHFAPIAIGSALTLIHLITIPITNTSVNPARSFGPALFVGGWAIEQLWLFFAAPLLGAIVGAVAFKTMSKD
ncbi:MAG: aquaporin Z, partial [Bdellovibrionaceae bacterium]|nr:aquaporin Z [Pseudobdellovibrionaceae bacterium]